MPAAHKAPAVARSITPVMKIAVSNRVISQLLGIAAPPMGGEVSKCPMFSHEGGTSGVRL